MRRAERLFRLVNELRAGRVTRAEDRARRLEVSCRTVYRDIAHLQASGLPIDGAAGVGYLLRPGFDLPAMTFTFDQIDALATGLAFVEAAGDPTLAHAAREARAKLQASLPDPHGRVLDTAPFFAARRDGRAADVARVVRRAIRRSLVLDLHYTDAEGRASARRVRPLAVWACTDGWLFAAWCEHRRDFRAFRLDRITAIMETGDCFGDEAGRDLPAYLVAKDMSGPPATCVDPRVVQPVNQTSSAA